MKRLRVNRNVCLAEEAPWLALFRTFVSISDPLRIDMPFGHLYCPKLMEYTCHAEIGTYKSKMSPVKTKSLQLVYLGLC